jgi:hypothetical protein
VPGLPALHCHRGVAWNPNGLWGRVRDSLQVNASAVTHCMPGRFLKVADFFLGVSKNLFLQAAELLPSTAHKLPGLLLEFADEGPDGPDLRS